MRIWQRLLHILIPAMLSFQAHNQITGSRQGAGDLFLTCALLDVSDVLWGSVGYWADPKAEMQQK